MRPCYEGFYPKPPQKNACDIGKRVPTECEGEAEKRDAKEDGVDRWKGDVSLRCGPNSNLSFSSG